MTRPAYRTARLLVPPAPAPAGMVRLLCLPHAGGGAGTFAAWPRLLGPEIDIVAVRLPGRESCFDQPRYRRMRTLIADLADAVQPYLNLPFALYGHSVGALIAYELAGVLDRPDQLVVAGAGAPHLPLPTTLLHQEPDHRLRLQLERLGGFPPETMADPDLVDLMLPTIRDDLALVETHRPAPGPALECPVLALAGRDDPATAAADVDAWQQVTIGRFTRRTFAGGHFFVRESQAEVLPVIRRALLDRHGMQGSRR